MTALHGTSTGLGLEERAARLLAEMADDPYGRVSASVYETARMVVLASWLEGQAQRLRFLLDAQAADGSWGGPGGYRLVPTLSAVHAIIATLTSRERPASTGLPPDRLARAALAGLRALTASRLAFGPVPETIAAELIIPWLVEETNELLSGDRDGTRDPLPAGFSEFRLHLPPGATDDVRRRLHDAADGGRLPEKLWHSLEAVGSAVAGFPGIKPAGGAVGCSPAATAAWLGPARRMSSGSSVAYLRTLQSRCGGALPGVSPITYFERAWVLTALSEAGLITQPPHYLADSLEGSLGDDGAPAGPGLPPDSDDTAAVLHSLALLGRPHPTDPLRRYEEASYFRCFTGESTPSTSTNAHVLIAFAGNRAAVNGGRDPAIAKISRWLTGAQGADGAWTDKWHASPYYATVCCVAALSRLADRESGQAVDSAIAWTLDTQRSDGSWGRWSGTAEETAYALRTLLHAGRQQSDDRAAQAIKCGHDYLLQRIDDDEYRPLWHDKDLYAPITVIRAEILAALALTGGGR